MKKNLQLFLFSVIALSSNYQSIFAANNWLLGWLEDSVDAEGNKVTASERIRTWDIHLDDIPSVIDGMIDIFLWLAWTISVIFVIIGAYKMLFGSLTQDVTKWKSTIIMALTGFAISLLAWFIVKFIFNNFSG